MFSEKQKELLQMLKELGFVKAKEKPSDNGKSCYYEFKNVSHPGAEIVISTTFIETLIEAVDIECLEAMGFVWDYFDNLFYVGTDLSHESEELDVISLRQRIENFCRKIWNH